MGWNASSCLQGDQQMCTSGQPTIIGPHRAFAQHGIKPLTEHFPRSQANAALDHLRSGKSHYRIVLDADL